MHEMFTRDGRELSLDTVIYDRSKKKGQTMIDTIDRGCLEGGCLDRVENVGVRTLTVDRQTQAAPVLESGIAT